MDEAWLGPCRAHSGCRGAQRTLVGAGTISLHGGGVRRLAFEGRAEFSKEEGRVRAESPRDPPSRPAAGTARHRGEMVLNMQNPGKLAPRSGEE